MDTPKNHSIPTNIGALHFADSGEYPHIYCLYGFMELSG